MSDLQNMCGHLRHHFALQAVLIVFVVSALVRWPSPLKVQSLFVGEDEFQESLVGASHLWKMNQHHSSIVWKHVDTLIRHRNRVGER